MTREWLRIGFLLFGSGSFIAVAPAQADSRSVASIIGLTYELFDLNPGDGIDPAIATSNIRTQASAYVINGGQDAVALQITRRRTSFAAITAVAPVPADFDISANSRFDGSLTGSMYANTYVNLDGFASSSFLNSYDIRLTPYTALTFTGTMHTYAASQGEKVGSYDQYAVSEVTFALQFPTDPNPFSRVQSIAVYPKPGTFAFNENLVNKSFEASFFNTSANYVTGSLSASASSLAQNSALAVSAVPESEAYVMYLTGLAVVGAAALRRRKPL